MYGVGVLVAVLLDRFALRMLCRARSAPLGTRAPGKRVAEKSEGAARQGDEADEARSTSELRSLSTVFGGRYEKRTVGGIR